MELVNQEWTVKNSDELLEAISRIKSQMEEALLGKNKCYLHLLVLKTLPQDKTS